MRTVTWLCALGLILAIGLPAGAEVQSVKVGGDVTVYGVMVEDYDLNADAADNADYIMTSTRLRIDADLTDNVSAAIGMINERIWDVETAADTDIDLDLANITLKEMLYSPVTFCVGRQPLRFGNGLVVGDPDTNAIDAIGALLDLSQRKSFDAIRATLDYDPYVLDLVLAEIDENTLTKSDDVMLLGANMVIPLEGYEAAMEVYLFGESDKNTGYDKNATTNVLGVCGSLVPMEGLTVSGELAYQFGDYAVNNTTVIDRDAMAFDLGVDYVLDAEFSPVLCAKYTYRSGESDATPTSGEYEAWDVMYEDQGNGGIANYILAGNNAGVASNCHIIGVSGSIMPTEQLSLMAEYFHYMLDEKPGSTTLATTTGSYTVKTNEDALGDELDLTLSYNYTEDVQLGLQLSIFMPGDVFDGVNDDDATYVLGWLAVTF